MKELVWYLGGTYSDKWQPAIMTENLAIFPNPEMLTTIPDLDI